MPEVGRDRLLSWALRRQGKDTPPLVLSSRRVYILPTRAGWAFGAVLAVTFIAGINYGNGLAMLLCCWLAGFGLVAMLQTQRQLSGLRITSGSAEPAFAGNDVSLHLLFEARSRTSDLMVGLARSQGVAVLAGDVAGTLQLELQLPAATRGPWRAPPLRLESSAPFGLFRTWAWMQLEVGTLVYPAPQGSLLVPEVPAGANGRSRPGTGLDEMAWLRPFREGDSPRQVAWKAYARGAPLLVREYQGNVAAARDFSFDALSDPDIEARLSQLCRWVVDAAAQNETWTMSLPGTSPLRGRGAVHKRECLARLALFGHVAGHAGGN
ncbi:MAG: DUF58 domain-containing protein [Pseudomonadota bacterium]